MTDSTLPFGYIQLLLNHTIQRVIFSAKQDQHMYNGIVVGRQSYQFLFFILNSWLHLYSFLKKKKNAEEKLTKGDLVRSDPTHNLIK